MTRIEEKKKKNELQSKKKKEDALALASRMATVSCTVAVKVIDEERLFGSVTTEMIQKALEAEGVNVDKKDIVLEEPIKKLGVYQIPITLHPEVSSSCKVWVVKA
jgi:large subunit ribosomal protein L9